MRAPMNRIVQRFKNEKNVCTVCSINNKGVVINFHFKQKFKKYILDK